MEAFEQAKGDQPRFKPLTNSPMYLNLGEGAQLAPDGRVYFVDIEGRKGERLDGSALVGPGIYRFDPKNLGQDGALNTALIEFCPTDGKVGCIGFTSEPDVLLAAVDKRLELINFNTQKTHHLADAPHEDTHGRFNDGATSPDGRYFFAGTIGGPDGRDGLAENAHLYAYDTQTGEMHVLLDNLQISNGLGWSPDGKAFYLTDLRIDKPGTSTYKFSYDGDAEPTDIISNKLVLFLFHNTDYPNTIVATDGMKVTADGNILVAISCVSGDEGGGFVRHYDYNFGVHTHEMDVLPGGQTTIPVTFEHDTLGVCMMVMTAGEHIPVEQLKADGHEWWGTPHIATNLLDRYKPQATSVLNVGPELLAKVDPSVNDAGTQPDQEGGP